MSKASQGITHIFFDLHGTLVDIQRLRQLYIRETAAILSARYGGAYADWAKANELIVLDWDSYYADLNLSGDDSLHDLYEGLYRVIRAHFRIVGVPEPDFPTLKALTLELNSAPPRAGDSFFPDAHPVVRALHERGYQLGVTTHALRREAESTLIGAGVRDYFTAPIVGPDVAHRFDKDRWFYQVPLRLAGIHPRQALVVDNVKLCIAGAKAAGTYTAYVNRKHAAHIPTRAADLDLGLDLTALPAQLDALQKRLRG